MIVIFISFLIFLVERKEEGMKSSYVVCKIKQHGRELSIVNSNHLGYQFSSNLYIELLMDEDVDNTFKGTLLKAICTLSNTNKVYDCTIVNEESKRYILLPSKVFEKVGIVLLSLCAINEDKTIVTTNCLKLYVDESNPIQAEIVPNKEQWEVEVLKVMKEWFHEKVEPLLETLNLKATDLQNIAEEQQIQVSELMENIQKKLSDGDFNGSSMLHGNGKPSDALGNDNDLYLDVLSTSETVWHIFAKENNVWVNKGGIQSKDGGKVLVGPDLETAQPKTLFIQNITQAQAIAETRGVNVNEYDARLPMNQVRISDEIGSQGLDEYLNKRTIKTPDTLELNELGAIQLEKEVVDPKSLSYEGNYVCSGCKPGTSPIDNVGCHITVKSLTMKDRTIIIDYRHNGTKWRNDMTNNEWSGWKLVEGEIILYNGSITASEGVISINAPLEYFNKIISVNSNGVSVEMPKDTNFVGSKCTITGTTVTNHIATFNIVSSQRINWVTYCDIKDNVVTPMITTKLIGRP